jgi:AcrR family transcriptional regulator
LQKINQIMFTQVKINLSEKLYLKDPESSDLGKKILEKSIELIENIGFEEFTFRKLGVLIGSNESSIYRYFESKHKLLLYLSSLFWGFKELKMQYETHYIKDSKEKLEYLLTIIFEDLELNDLYNYINVELLQKIIISDFSKSYLTKNVEQDNNEGYFLVYKRVILLLSDAIESYNPNYLYPKSLSNFIIDGVLHQSFVNNHFKKITNIHNSQDQNKFIKELVFKTLA